MSLTLLTLGAVYKMMQKKKADSTVIGFAPEPEAELDAPALRPFRPDGRVLESPFPKVSDEQWTDFVFAMKTSPLGYVSESNCLGMFSIRFKRLADLGLVTNVHYKKGTGNVQEADWVEPLTLEGFLGSAASQYKIFVESMRRYVDDLRGKELPSGMSVSGALAILHRGGLGALAKWQEMKFESTLALFNVVNGVF